MLIKIPKGAGGWWTDGDNFFTDRNGTPLDVESESAEELRETLCERVFNLYHWTGEAGPYGPVSVGFHSLLVSHLAGLLAEARDLSEDMVLLCRSMGAAHDLGETIAINDVAAPILRAHPPIRRVNERLQAAANALFYPWMRRLKWLGNVTCAAQVVHDADHLAAAIERRYLFGDNSMDMESPDADALIAEAMVGISAGRFDDMEMWVIVDSETSEEWVHGYPITMSTIIMRGCEISEALRCGR